MKIAQRKAGEAVVATHYLYDRSGRLTDVWQPAVDDALTPALNLIRPHYHYTYDSRGNQLTQQDANERVAVSQGDQHQ